LRDPAVQPAPRYSSAPPATPRPSTLAEEPAQYRIPESVPLARPREVSENKKVPLSKEELGRKVRDDPVVQEAVRTFGATIGEIHPK